MRTSPAIAGLLALLAFSARAATPSIADDVRTLNDTHAASGVKLAACQRLARATEATTPIRAALARQALYDHPDVRQAARDTLVKLEGMDRALDDIAAREKIETFVAAPVLGDLLHPFTGRDGAPIALEAYATQLRAALPLAPSLDLLFDPKAPTAAVYAVLHDLEHAGPDSPALRRLLNEARDDAPGPRRDRARWALWCVLGPRLSQWAIDLGVTDGPEPWTASLRARWAERITTCDDVAIAAALVRHPWPDFQNIGERALERMVFGDALLRARRADVAARRQADRLLIEQYARRARLETSALAAAAAGERVDQAILRTAVSHLDDPRQPVRDAARLYWDRLIDPKTRELIPAAVRPLAGLVLATDLPKGAEAHLFAHLDGASAADRRTAVAAWIRELSYGDERAGVALAHWKLDATPEARAARALHKIIVDQNSRTLTEYTALVNGADQSLRDWLATVSLGNRTDHAAALAALLQSNNLTLARTAATFAATDPDRFAVRAAAALLLTSDRRPQPDALAPLRDTAVAKDLQTLATQAIEHPANPNNVPAALHLLVGIGVTTEDARRACLSLLRDKDRDTRMLAARALGTGDALAIAAVPELLAQLRDDDPRRRSQAAHELHFLAVDTRAVTAALVRATDAGDMPVREGLTLALERAWGRRVPVEQILAAADAEAEPATKAYLRAARRAVTELGSPK